MEEHISKVDVGWASAPPTRFELWQTAMKIRVAMISLEAAVFALRAGDNEGLQQAIENFEEHDDSLGKSLDRLLKMSEAAADE